VSRAAQLLSGAACAAEEHMAALSLLDVEVRGAPMVVCEQKARRSRFASLRFPASEDKSPAETARSRRSVAHAARKEN
jgi:hypothetical protein